MFEAWMKRGQLFRKNDIYDFFFIGCSDYVDNTPAENVLIDRSTYLLTFDRIPARFIEKKKPANGKAIRRYFEFD